MRLLFTRATGLGDLAAEPGQTLDLQDPARVREVLSSGRAVPAPDEEPLAVPTVITSDAIAPPDTVPAPKRRNR